MLILERRDRSILFVCQEDRLEKRFSRPNGVFIHYLTSMIHSHRLSLFFLFIAPVISYAPNQHVVAHPPQLMPPPPPSGHWYFPYSPNVYTNCLQTTFKHREIAEN